MSTITARSVHDLLEKRDILPGTRNTEARWALAVKVAAQGRHISEQHLDRMFSHFAGVEQGAVSATVQALRDGSWIGLVSDLLAEASAEVAPSMLAAMKFVTAENPYGWSNEGPFGKDRLEDHHRRTDHNIPDKWNAWRQSFNIGVAQKRETMAAGFRRHGCSRDEVVGGLTIPPGWRPGSLIPEFQGREPRVFYDHQEVLDAVAAEAQRPRDGRDGP